MAPRPACLSLCALGGEPQLIPTPEARDVLVGLLSAGHTLVWHNGAFDAACSLAWWDCTDEMLAALDDGRMICTWTIARIAEISGLRSRGRLGLDDLCKYFGLRVPDKADVLDVAQSPVQHLYPGAPQKVRMSYGPLIDRPLSDYAPQQVQYALDDALLLAQLYERILERWINPGKVYLADAAGLLRKMLTLQATACWGLRTDPEQLGALRQSTIEELTTLRAAAYELGVIRANPKNKSGVSTVTKVLKDLVTTAYDGRPPMTEDKGRDAEGKRKDRPAASVTFKPLPSGVREVINGHEMEWRAIICPPSAEALAAAPLTKRGLPDFFVPQVKTSRAVLEESGDARLEMLASMGELNAIESMVLPAFEAGAYEPIHTRYSIVDTTRVSSSKPNVQNVRRAEGVRECFIPRRGYCYVHVDHGGLENATLAQAMAILLGNHGFCDFLNDDGTGTQADLHSLVASVVAGVSYVDGKRLYAANDDSFCRVRSAVKPVNFGRPGGAGAATLKFIAKQMYKLDWSLEETKHYIKAWENAVPGGKDYHRWVGNQGDENGRYSVPILGTTIMRRGCTFCSAANNGFQATGAVIEGVVGWAMFLERLTGRTPHGGPSVLQYGGQCNFIHDEFAWEIPIGLQGPAAGSLEWHMAHSARHLHPDVGLHSEAVAMAVWSKAAKRIVTSKGLQIWRPHRWVANQCECGAARRKRADGKKWDYWLHQQPQPSEPHCNRDAAVLGDTREAA